MSTQRSSGLDFRDVPAAVRAVGVVGWRAARWSLGISLRVGTHLARSAAEPVLTTGVAVGIGSLLRTYARDLLGITELEERLRQALPPEEGAGQASANGAAPDAARLRVQGARLLRAAAEVDVKEHAHPAYARILTELDPDEARILRLLATDGPQPSVDVRAGNLLGFGTAPVAEGLNMIGAQAGCRDRERVPAYLNNLERLGLIWFSREPLEEPIAYQVLEAQPEVMEALKGAARAKTIQRSIKLTPFGQDFCRVCLPLDTAEMEALSSEAETSAD